MSGSAELVATVNSVVARWVVTLEAQPAGKPGRAVVIASLRSSQGDNAELQERHEATGVASEVGTMKFSGVAEFHFLHPKRRYDFVLQVELPNTTKKSEPLLSRKVETQLVGRGLPPALAQRLPPEMWRLYIGKEHDLGEWLAGCPGDIVWAFEPDFELLRALWLSACFTLPNPASPITQCPNPCSRYCLDLTRGCPWLRCKKLRRHKADFTLTVNRDYKGTFAHCGRLHKEQGRGEWITPKLVEALDTCRLEAGEIKVYAVELWEKRSGKLAAAIMSFSVGDIFHDYSTATMLRDKRSPGAILTKVLGHLLTECGYTLWYWGFKNPYMAEYDERYGGLTLENRAFWPRWQAARRLATLGDTVISDEQSSLTDLVLRVPPGGLDLASV